MSPTRTRIKICGLTRETDVDAAVQAGADAIGFVLYPKSPRFVSPERAGELARRLPPFVTPVLLFVNASPEFIAQGVAAVPDALLQFHGDESPADCLAAGRPFLRAARIPAGAAATGFDLLKYADEFIASRAILLDALVDGYGGGGHAFDWTVFPWSHPRLNASSRLVLSGGLTPANVIDGIARVRPWAVDVSSGVEATGPDGQTLKGIKDAGRMQAFVAAVRAADTRQPPPPN
ncbi:MAG TPA: phosphoribosylanthranilate isomerase [Hydrogenophaga sp.]|uniref:phosphoribosylanthranilate isomerase n=1 Tax=Hydrogenophaga sp. TaxID=1904254 RepID=UPI002CB1B76F|nr:phosphoribosylanthranilate isomerase [Hydrogenophaga sp.]HMN94565.1 phosphoribosylanthranilate isomerase [Hydrogenophaga sp.]HMP10055.1 phosphoribosylanthranilate isomerase [Hydrogenophaga sp.]